MISFREATSADIPVIVTLLADDVLGATRETADPAQYSAAFLAMQAEAANHLIVGEISGGIVATYQITYISGLSLRACRRAQIESVRIAVGHRGKGLGAALVADAEARARAAGCGLIQLTTNRERSDARRFYEQQGFAASHVGFKKMLE